MYDNYAHSIVDQNSYHYRYYGYVAAEHRKWEYRLPILQQTIRNFNTDIICLQEADLPSFEQDFGAFFAQNGNYQTVLNDARQKKKNSENKKGFVMTMTTPILFKRDKFKLICSDFRSKATLTLLQFISNHNHNNNNNNDPQTTTEESKQSNTEHTASDNNEEQKEQNMSQPANKQKKKKKKQQQQKVVLDANESYIWVCNVHLEGDPKRPDTRFSQIKNILNRITNKSNEYKLDVSKVHVVITGDFNAGKGEVVDELLLSGALKWDYRQQGYPDVDVVQSKNKSDYSHPWKFGSAYDHIEDEAKRKQILTFYARDSFACIDHVYFTRNTAQCLFCTETVPPWLAQNEKLQCPNEKLVSDHLPIASFFQVNS